MKIIDSDLKTLIGSLKDQCTSLLVIDSTLCPHSKRLLDEIEIASSLAPSPSSSTAASGPVMHVLDLGKKMGPAIDMLTWLPGVPCLLAASKVHLGVDAFAKCREICRNPEGITIHHFRTF